MRLRAAIRYSEFKNADKLPSNILTDCAECIEKELYHKYNCDGEGNPKYVQNIGNMEFYQCPLSLFTQETWDVIDLITTSLETGIPIAGTDLLSQTRAFYKFKRIINSEKYDCMKEIDEMRKVEDKRNERKSAAKSSTIGKPRRQA